MEVPTDLVACSFMFLDLLKFRILTTVDVRVSYNSQHSLIANLKYKVSSMKYELNPSLFTSLHSIDLYCSLLFPSLEGTCCGKQLNYPLLEYLKVFQ